MSGVARTALMFLVAALPLLAQERPLPDLATLLQQAREHLRDDWRLENHYTYLERRTDYKPGEDGKEEPQSVKLYEVTPTPGGRPYRRLIEVNGHRRSAEELARDDREHRNRVAERQREAQSPAGRQRQTEREAKRQREEQETWDDMARVYTFTIVGRERVEGQLLVIVDFQPKADSQPRTDNGERMKKVRGRAWISEDDYQVARVEAKVLEDISVGWGLIGKLYAGAVASCTCAGRCTANSGCRSNSATRHPDGRSSSGSPYTPSSTISTTARKSGTGRRNDTRPPITIADSWYAASRGRPVSAVPRRPRRAASRSSGVALADRPRHRRRRPPAGAFPSACRRSR